MKVSVNWLKEYTKIDLPIDKLVEKIGAQLGAVEEVVDLGKKYEGIVVAKVISCAKHPNADKLSVCMIDTGKRKVQVVCGAPNVREGLLAAWIPPGTTVPSTFDKDPFVLEAKELRGVVSSGMLASASELDISDDHSGIVELDRGKPGDDFAKTFELDDYIIDIENKMFTHRPDCFGILGVAREIAGITGKTFKSPDWFLNPPKFAKAGGLDLEVVNMLDKAVPRFMAVAVKDVEIHPSSFYNQTYLAKIGIRPINNIVDLTNLFMYLTGQPMHAYDYDKVAASSRKGAKIVVRYPRKDEKLKLLGGKIITPHEQAICIATDKELIGLGGVMGGADTEVDKSTKNIIFECANFDLYSIRRTSMIHGLFTDAVTRFSKGQSVYQNDRILYKAMHQLVDNSEASQASNVIDAKARLKPAQEISVSAEFIKERLGLGVTIQSIVTLLENVEFDVKSKNNNLLITPPFWRKDIHIAEDIVEEVGRLVGYDKLPLVLPRRTSDPAVVEPELSVKQELRETLASLGANETLNYSFVHGNLLEACGQDPKIAFRINNALSPDLQYYRLSILPSLLASVHANIKAGFDKFALFEIGKVHCKTEVDKDGLPIEYGRLSLVTANKNQGKQAAYYEALAFLTPLLEHRFDETSFVKLSENKIKGHQLFDQMIAPFEPSRSALIFNGKGPLGVVGEFKANVSKKLKLPIQAAGFELFLNPFVKNLKSTKYNPIPRFPSAEQDITLQTKKSQDFKSLADALVDSMRKHIPKDVEFTSRCIGIFSNDEKTKNITFRVSFVSNERTLTDEITNKTLDRAANDLVKKAGAKRI